MERFSVGTVMQFRDYRLHDGGEQGPCGSTDRRVHRGRLLIRIFSAQRVGLLRGLIQRALRTDAMHRKNKVHIIDGKPMTPGELRRLHRYLLTMDVIEAISDEMRVVVESEWPVLVHVGNVSGTHWRPPYGPPSMAASARRVRAE
jgi:hypothetical protein